MHHTTIIKMICTPSLRAAATTNITPTLTAKSRGWTAQEPPVVTPKRPNTIPRTSRNGPKIFPKLSQHKKLQSRISTLFSIGIFEFYSAFAWSRLRRVLLHVLAVWCLTVAFVISRLRLRLRSAWGDALRPGRSRHFCTPLAQRSPLNG